MNLSSTHGTDGEDPKRWPARGAAHRRVAATGLVALALGASCNGTETDNPATGNGLIDFHDTGCKSHAEGDETPSGPSGKGSGRVDAGIGGTTRPLTVASDYDGLQCVAWELGGDAALRLRFINFHEGCGVEWKGRIAGRSEGSLELEVVNDQCGVAACGWCIYDWDFEVAEVDRATSLALNLTAVMDGPGCSYEAGRRLEAELPIDREPEGVLCRYAHPYAIEQLAEETGICGASRMPCSGSNLCDPSADPCASGLTCTPVEDGGSRCLEACTSDAECEPSGPLVCRDGLCQLDTEPELPPWQELPE